MYLKTCALYILVLFAIAYCQTHHHHNPFTELSKVHIECNSDDIVVKVSARDHFNGMIYPKGLSKNSSCLAEYEDAGSTVTYRLPLRSCNTMAHDMKNGVEYFNTVVIQPHQKLVTNHGKGYNVRCRYHTKEKATGTTTKYIGMDSSMHEKPPLPNCAMKIYVANSEHVVAESVKIGDFLTLVISIDEQDYYGLKVTNCLVRDGLKWAEEPLINTEGCPIDEDIMGNFEYNANLTEARVSYPAHKFPFTYSVYYQCNVKLCMKKNGGCDDVPPLCDATGHNIRRRRRRRQNEVISDRETVLLQEEDSRDRSIEVYSGLYVNELGDLEDEERDLPATFPSQSDDFCVSTRKFAIGIAIAGVLLMLAVIMLVAYIVHRRRRRKGSSTAGSSIYSGPYSNHAYSRD